MGAIFISYRREDTEGQARALYQDLVGRFGRDSVFMDVDSIALGRDFRDVLHERLASCDGLLALIGKEWLSGQDKSGRRRIENPDDFVRLEIAAALKRNIPVTPVLLQGAQMPPAADLPDDLKDLVYRNGFELSHNRWESDVQELIRRLGLDAHPADSMKKGRDVPQEPKPGKKSPAVVAGAALLVVALVLAGRFFFKPGDNRGTIPAASGRYHVVVASDPSQAVAIKKSEELRQSGYPSEVHSTKGGYAITIGRYSLEDANAERAKAIKAGFKDAWISEGKTWREKVYP